MGGAGAAIISAGAVISITGNLNILLLSGSRVPFAMAEQRQLPSLHRKSSSSLCDTLRCDPDNHCRDAAIYSQEFFP